MGGCFSERGPKNNSLRSAFYPLLSPSQTNIQNLMIKWDKQQLCILKDQINSICGAQITKQQLTRIFPNLRRYSQETQNKIYSLINTRDKFLVKIDILNAITLFYHGDQKVIARAVFWIYSKQSQDDIRALDKRTMNQTLRQLFYQENKDFIKDQYDAAVQEKLLQQQTINFDKFQKIFLYFQYTKFKSLLEWTEEGMQAQLIALIKKNSPIIRKNGDPVYVLEYQWFRSWYNIIYFRKRYMQNVHDCKIIFESIKDKKIDLKQSKEFKRQDYHFTQFSQVNIKSNIKKPLNIRNNSLQGFYPNQLARNLTQYKDYILIPQWLWKPLEGLYQGGPIYKRTYPEIYSLSVIQVYTKQGQFLPKKVNDNLNITINGNSGLNKSLRQIANNDPQLNQMKLNNIEFHCFYKYSGKLQWSQVQSLDNDISDYLSRHRTFICFVGSLEKAKFLQNYNCTWNKQVKVIKNRIKNYASIVKVPMQGGSRRGQVMKIIDKDYVIVQVQDRQGNFNRKRIQVSILNKYNPQQINQQLSDNLLAGMENLGNTCYINSVIQCLIRTPYLCQYLAKQNYQSQQKQQLLLDTIYQIFARSTKSTQLIQTTRLKRTIQNYFPAFKGFSQQDAQQLLISILSKISQEIRDKDKKKKNLINKQIPFVKSQIKTIQAERNQLTMSQSQKKSMIAKKNSVIISPSTKKQIRFFSGTIQTFTTCFQCNNKSQKLQQSFFTYSLSLPHHVEKQFYFTYIPRLDRLNKQWQPIRYGITLKSSITFQQALQPMSKLVGKPLKQLFFIPVFNSQWMHNFTSQQYQKQLSFFTNYNMNIVCYQVLYRQKPSYQDFLIKKDFIQKSVKFELRHRYYRQKNNTYQSFFIPYLVEINQFSRWQDIELQLTGTLQKFIDDKYLEEKALSQSISKDVRKNKLQNRNKNRENSQQKKQDNKEDQHKVVTSQIRISKKQTIKQSNKILSKEEFKNSIVKQIKINDKDVRETQSQFRQNNKQKQYQKQISNQSLKNELRSSKNSQKKPYRIRLISKSSYGDDFCLICRSRFQDFTKNQQNGDNKSKYQKYPTCKGSFCQYIGCTFKKDSMLYQDQQIRYRTDNIIMVVDWSDHYAFKVLQNKFDQSYQKSKLKTINRVDKLDQILSRNITNNQILEFKCLKDKCKGQQISRTQTIKVFPNIFILHLKRFRYQDCCLVKLMNSIQYPVKLAIGNENYTLYGVIVHNGTGLGGHYYSYVNFEEKWVKCDDQKVTKAEGNEYIHPDAYILFYRKTNFQVGLTQLSF